MSSSDSAPSSDPSGSGFNIDPSPQFPFQVRSYQDSDLQACQRLYSEGLLGGKIAENDTGFDIDNISQAYLKNEGSHFWVAVDEAGQVVGMIGVQKHEEGNGEIRRLRVATSHRRRGIGKVLVERAVKFCNDHQCLKVTLDTYVDHDPAVKLFEKFRFHHWKTKKVGDKELLYFYLDLYQGDRPRPKADGQGK
jgi:ribosomal protein S18 acetylase RimI-like enzyme